MANRLAGAASPYLLQHQDNPVDWWPWCEDAFEQARRRDVPLLLSVGYAACHWCHVMAHESFEDPATAALMNERFVNIKVDREERPDIDAAYLAATEALTGQGGWPMTVFLAHDGTPFFAGTYFPPRPRAGLPGFTELLEAVSQTWRARRGEVESAARRIAGALAARRPAAGDGP
ncbi:MAG TPA: thioredoxin domain-containing protein, partial [Kineosporiaceae bacterium]|nr:thioredoxin domain-containing protein [Kineosporiaceae bacterium]